MGQLEKDLVGEMLGKEDGPFATAGWAEIKPVAGELPEYSLQNASGRFAIRNRKRLLQWPHSGLVQRIRATPWR